MSAHSEAMSQDEENQGVDEEYSFHSLLDISKKKLRSSQMDGEDNEMRTKSKRRSQRYRTAWESQPELASWIQPVMSDVMSAQCTLCSNIMKAEITVLRRHASSTKHMKNAEAAELGESNINFLYKREWERHKNFMHWISRVENNEKEALCTVCQVRINANLSELKLHSRSEMHLNNLSEINCESKVEEVYDVKIVKPRPIQLKKEGTIGNFDLSTAHALDLDEFVMDNKLSNLRIEEDRGTLLEDDSETPIRVYRVKPSDITIQNSAGLSGGAPSKTPSEEEPGQALVTQPAPSWKGKAVVNGQIQELKLSDYRGRYLVMFFYPQDFSTVCSTEILALGDVISAFRVINCEVIAVSVDSHLAHLAWTKTLILSSSASKPEPPKLVPLLSDSTHAISRSYGCFLPAAGHSLRAYYIIDKRGYLRAMNISDIQVGRNLKEILRLVEAFQLVDSTNTQCPVNWTTGQPSVKVAL